MMHILIFPKKFWQNSMHYTWQNMVHFYSVTRISAARVPVDEEPCV